MKIEIEKPTVPQWFDEWYKTFEGHKANALYFLNRTGWGYDLTYDNEQKVEFYAGKLRGLSDNNGYSDAQEYLSKAILFGYEVEKEPLYYAKIKGWEILGGGFKWVYLENSKELIIGDVIFPDDETEAMTKEEWNKVGINDTNADFEEVD